MSIALTARPLDPAALAPFATVIASPDGKARVIAEAMAHDGVPGAHALTVLCPQPVAAPVAITALERHPHSTQSFLPLTVGRWLILVAPTAADGTPDLSGARAFVAGPTDAICIARDVWHAGLTVFDQPAQFAMLMWKAESADDGVAYTLATPITVTL